MKAARAGGNIPTAFNAANERAVALFLNKKIKYLEIIDIIEACMENASFIENPSVDEIQSSAHMTISVKGGNFEHY